MGCKIFITATDTEAGKTWVTASAIRLLLEQGMHAKALKPVACGLNEAGKNEDIETLLAAQGLGNANYINLYRYASSVAPSQSAAAEGQLIDTGHLVRWCNQQSEDMHACLIEGVGGLMTPLTDSLFVSDWIEAMEGCEVWLVIGCKLGAINQAMLTLEKLKQMGCSPVRIFFNATTVEQNAWIQPVMDAVVPFVEDSCHIIKVQYMEPVTL